MGKISDAAANQLLDVMFGQIANPFPAIYYIALSTTLPTNTGTNVTEPSTSGTAYARMAVDNDDVSFVGAAARQTSIAVEVVFPEATGAGWGHLTHFAIYDAATAGNFMGWGALATPIDVIAGGIVTFIPDSLVITAPGA
jgi:hypothetical protein